MQDEGTLTGQPEHRGPPAVWHRESAPLPAGARGGHSAMLRWVCQSPLQATVD